MSQTQVNKRIILLASELLELATQLEPPALPQEPVPVEKGVDEMTVASPMANPVIETPVVIEKPSVIKPPASALDAGGPKSAGRPAVSKITAPSGVISADELDKMFEGV